MTTPTQRLIQRDIRARNDVRRATVLTDPALEFYDPAGQNSNVWTIRVDIGEGETVDGVVVKSMTGIGGRGYARPGASVDIQRDASGRWLCIGPSNRKRGTGEVTLFNPETGATTSGGGDGLTSARKPYSYYQGDLPGVPNSGRYGSQGYGDMQIFDGDGNEVI